MGGLSEKGWGTLAPGDGAAQHGPRPLPLFLDILQAETAGAPERRAAAMAGLRLYQSAARPARPAPMPVVAQAGRAVLRDYGGTGPPAVFVPSLINPPFILDLAEGNSLLRWLSAQGVRVLMVDWGDPSLLLPGTGRGTARSAVEGAPAGPGSEPGPLHHSPSASGPPPRSGEESVSNHISHLLLPLLDALGEPAHLVGYCLGGTMALGAAMHARLLSLTLIAAPWRFAGFGDTSRREIGALWTAARPSCEALGLVPMEVLQTGFWRLDPGRTIAKYEAFARMDPDSDAARAFVALEDWANEGAPLTLAAGRELFEDFVGADITGEGRWHVAGRPVDAAALTVPAREFVSRHDRIVPAASAAGLPEQVSLGLGHVGMIVGSRARDQLWRPLAAMLSQVPQS